MPRRHELIADRVKPGVRRRNNMATIEVPAAVRALHEVASKPLRECTIQAQEWLFARVGEVHQTHGICGVGVCGLLSQAAQCYAWAWYYHARACEADGDGADARRDNCAQKAAYHGAHARQHELAAYELGVREGKAHRAAVAHKNLGRNALLAAQDEGREG